MNNKQTEMQLIQELMDIQRRRISSKKFALQLTEYDFHTALEHFNIPSLSTASPRQLDLIENYVETLIRREAKNNKQEKEKETKKKIDDIQSRVLHLEYEHIESGNALIERIEKLEIKERNRGVDDQLKGRVDNLTVQLETIQTWKSNLNEILKRFACKADAMEAQNARLKQKVIELERRAGETANVESRFQQRVTSLEQDTKDLMTVVTADNRVERRLVSLEQARVTTAFLFERARDYTTSVLFFVIGLCLAFLYYLY